MHQLNIAFFILQKKNIYIYRRNVLNYKYLLEKDKNSSDQH